MMILHDNKPCEVSISGMKCKSSKFKNSFTVTLNRSLNGKQQLSLLQIICSIIINFKILKSDNFKEETKRNLRMH